VKWWEKGVFEDRKDAGKRLADALEEYRDRDVLILAIPKGGVEVGYYVARSLHAQFSILIARKLPFPSDQEAGFGALAEDGSIFFVQDAGNWVSRSEIDRIIETQKEEIKRRIVVLRRGKPLPTIEDRTVILVDDGIAMGSTMRTAVMLCQKAEARKIIVAVPVTGEKTAREIGKLVDEIVVLVMPRPFYAVAQVYKNWYDVSDREVIAIMDRWYRTKQ